MTEPVTAANNERVLTYAATFTAGEDGWTCAQIVELPEAISRRSTFEEAKANVAEALEAAIAGRLDEGERTGSGRGRAGDRRSTVAAETVGLGPRAEPAATPV